MYNYQNKKCIISGGSGFIGQNLVNKLVEQGAEVWVIDNFSFGALKENINPKAKIIESDIRNQQSFKELPKDADYFFHFAAPSSTVLFADDPKDCFDITLGGFINVLNFCAENKTRLIYPSSGKVYMGQDGLLSEGNQIKEQSLDAYARAKYANEIMAFAYKDIVDSIGLRIFTGYGPSEKHKGDFASTIYLFTRDMVQGKSPIIWGDGTQKRDFVFESDLADMVLAFGQEAKEPIINVGTGSQYDYNYVVEVINEILGKNIKPEYLKKPNFFAGNTLADTKIIKKYYPEIKYPLKKGIEKVVKSLI